MREHVQAPENQSNERLTLTRNAALRQTPNANAERRTPNAALRVRERARLGSKRSGVGVRTIARAQRALQSSLPWWLVKRWPGTPIADEGALHRQLGLRLTHTEHGIIAVVRKAVRARGSGVHVSTRELALRFDCCERTVFRALRRLERLELVRRVHQFEQCDWVDETGRVWKRRQAPSVLVLGEALRTPCRARRSDEARKALHRADRVRRSCSRSEDRSVTPKTPPPPTGEGGRGRTLRAVEPDRSAPERGGVASGDGRASARLAASSGATAPIAGVDRPGGAMAAGNRGSTNRTAAPGEKNPTEPFPGEFGALAEELAASLERARAAPIPIRPPATIARAEVAPIELALVDDQDAWRSAVLARLSRPRPEHDTSALTDEQLRARRDRMVAAMQARLASEGFVVGADGKASRPESELEAQWSRLLS